MSVRTSTWVDTRQEAKGGSKQYCLILRPLRIWAIAGRSAHLGEGLLPQLVLPGNALTNLPGGMHFSLFQIQSSWQLRLTLACSHLGILTWREVMTAVIYGLPTRCQVCGKG